MQKTKLFLNKPVRRYAVWLSILFLLSIALGYYGALLEEEEALKLWGEMTSTFESADSGGPVTFFLFIFFNNTVKTFLFMLLGFFFGIAPLLFVFSNGFILGLTAYIVSSQISPLVFILPILPHALLEIPAFIIASSCGLWLGNRFIKGFKHKGLFSRAVREVMYFYIYIIVPLFFVAAAIEITVSSFLLDLLTQ